MKFFSKPAQTLVVEARCDSCNVGFLKATQENNQFLSDKPYEHKCNHCGHTQYLTQSFPAITAVSDPYDILREYPDFKPLKA